MTVSPTAGEAGPAVEQLLRELGHMGEVVAAGRHLRQPQHLLAPPFGPFEVCTATVCYYYETQAVKLQGTAAQKGPAGQNEGAAAGPPSLKTS